MIHAVETKDGVSHMIDLMALDLPAGQLVKLTPNATHLMLMLMGLKQKLIVGGSFTLTLHFEHARAVTVAVPVLGIAAMGPDE